MAKEDELDNERDLDSRVRRRIRELRLERGLTISALAELASIDVSTLSRLEAGKRRLAVDHLPVLARALGITVDELLAPISHPDPRVVSRPQRLKGMTLWPLTRNGPAKGLQTVKMRIEADRNVPPAELPVHEGQDWVYVLSGKMRLILGEDDMVIEPGEAVEFSTWTPHWFGAIDEPVELLAIIGVQGEQAHFHEGAAD
ncbi:MAG: XRE family transcriptional regulator [Actinomycetota bacterium]|nr:XRE family transcriptional regulator [Actinomycetota bacterium]